MSDVKWAPGTVVWRELMTTDVEKAKGFYGELFGWSYQEFDMGPDGKYPMITAGGQQYGGIAKAQGGAPPHWLSYVSVPDVDKSVAAATARGGKTVFGPMDVPDIGRMAGLADFAGAVIAVMHSPKGDMVPEGRPGLGAFCWETLTTTDLEKAKDYYGAVIGWKPVAGPDPNMLVFGTDSGAQIADVQSAGAMPASWLTYVVVDKHDAARDKAARLGAKVLVPRIDVPKVGSIALIADPQGAVIGLFEPEPMG